MLKEIKSIDKEIIVVAHYETLNVEGDQEKRVKVKGEHSTPFLNLFNCWNPLKLVC
jgi:hypothetical protein